MFEQVFGPRVPLKWSFFSIKKKQIIMQFENLKLSSRK